MRNGAAFDVLKTILDQTPNAGLAASAGVLQVSVTVQAVHVTVNHFPAGLPHADTDPPKRSRRPKKNPLSDL